MLMKNGKDEATALFGYTAYVAKGGNKNERPIMFAYNGGPGSASIWLHMGILGPQRAVIADAGWSDNGPYQRVNNEYSIIDEVDRRFSLIHEYERIIEFSLKRAERLRQAILQKAFGGQLVPQNPDDEPASVLLERIRAERSVQQMPLKI